MRYINNHVNSLTRGSVEQLKAENNFSRYGDVLLPDVEPFHPSSKDAAFSSMYDFPEKYQVFKLVVCVNFFQ